MVWTILMFKIEDIRGFDPLFAEYIEENSTKYVPDLSEIFEDS